MVSICYSAADRIAEIYNMMAVSLCVCLSVLDHISGTTRTIFTYFCACYLWSWLGPPLVASRYVMYFRFYGRRHTSHKLRQLSVAAQLMGAQPTCSLRLGYKQHLGIPVAGQWTVTHRPTFWVMGSGPIRLQWMTSCLLIMYLHM